MFIGRSAPRLSLIANKPFIDFVAEFDRLSLDIRYDSYLDGIKIERLEKRLYKELR